MTNVLILGAHGRPAWFNDRDEIDCGTTKKCEKNPSGVVSRKSVADLGSW